MKNFIKIEIALATSKEAEILLAELAEKKFYAFEQNQNILIAYITEEDFDERSLSMLLSKHGSYKRSIIKDRNWNEEWESQVQPVTIKNFVGIRASFHAPLKNVEHEIIITPKMSFGTGHHPSTFLMIEMMQSVNFKNKSVLDFGTGTGVLAILAEKLGAASVAAIDCDEWSIENAFENIRANQCKNIILDKKNTIIGVASVDIILANINFNVLRENAVNFSMLLEKNSMLVISGILQTDEEEIDPIFVKNGFVKNKRYQKDEWVALLFENQ